MQIADNADDSLGASEAALASLLRASLAVSALAVAPRGLRPRATTPPRLFGQRALPRLATSQEVRLLHPLVATRAACRPCASLQPKGTQDCCKGCDFTQSCGRFWMTLVLVVLSLGTILGFTYAVLPMSRRKPAGLVAGFLELASTTNVTHSLTDAIDRFNRSD